MTCTNDEWTYQKAWKTKCHIWYGDTLGDVPGLGGVDELWWKRTVVLLRVLAQNKRGDGLARKVKR